MLMRLFLHASKCVCIYTSSFAQLVSSCRRLVVLGHLGSRLLANFWQPGHMHIFLRIMMRIENVLGNCTFRVMETWRPPREIMSQFDLTELAKHVDMIQDYAEHLSLEYLLMSVFFFSESNGIQLESGRNPVTLLFQNRNARL